MNNINLNEIKHRMRTMGKLFHVGLTGGVATGKTTVAEMFHGCGAHLIDFDILAREVVEPDTECLARVVTCFGSQVLDSSGCLDRKLLSGIVFKDPVKRKQLEAILHPAIFQLFCQKVTVIARQEPEAVIFSVIPLLMEMKLQPLFDRIIVVHISSEIQLKRLIQRDGIDDKAALNIINSQMPIDEKLKYADFLVDNSSGLEQSRSQVLKIWHEME